MPYPPVLPSGPDRTNDTDSRDLHPQDHNQIHQALRDLVAELGNNPSGPYSDLSTRLDAGIAAIQGSVPTGIVQAYTSDLAPPGFVLCDGAAYSRTDPVYATLFGVVGTRFGAGDGSTTFNVPNLRGAVVFGVDGSAEFGAIGQRGGAKAHVISNNEMPVHNHYLYTAGDDRDHAHATNAWTGGFNTNHTHVQDGPNQFSIQAPDGASSGIVNGPNDGWTRGVRGNSGWADRDHAHYLSAWSGGINTGHLHQIPNDGAGWAMPIVNPYVTLTYVIKL